MVRELRPANALNPTCPMGKFLLDCEDIRLATRLLLAKKARLIAQSERIWAHLIQSHKKSLSGDSAPPRIRFKPQRRVLPFPLSKVKRKPR